MGADLGAWSITLAKASELTGLSRSSLLRRADEGKLQTVFVSGQIAVRPGGGPMDVVGTTMQEQTRQAMRNVETVLKAAGSSLDKVVKITILLAKPDQMKEMNEAYAEFFPNNKPAQAITRFGPEIPGILVSIEAMALAA